MKAQLLSFLFVGLLAAFVHYTSLIGLVEMGVLSPVPATLCGYVLGGLTSYGLNRTHTFRSERPHGEAGWRFAVVAGVGFGLTGLLMQGLHEGLGVPYLPAQVLTTLIVMLWSFVAHKLWTFGDVYSPK